MLRFAKFRAMSPSRVILCAVLCGVVTSTPAAAQDADTKVLGALNNLHSEMITCLAYYSIFKQCLGKSDPLYNATDKIIDHLTSFSIRVGDTIGMTQDAMASRVQIQMDQQMNLIQKNCVNISSLLSRHGARCKQVVESGDTILNDYMKR